MRPGRRRKVVQGERRDGDALPECLEGNDVVERNVTRPNRP